MTLALGSSDGTYKKLLWADIRDLRRPAGVAARGVRFLTCVELQTASAFILEGLRNEEGASAMVMRRFVTAAFFHALSQCMAWELKDPKLFLFVGARDGPAVMSRISEVYGGKADGPLVLKLESGESMVIDLDAGPFPSGPLKRLFPPA